MANNFKGKAKFLAKDNFYKNSSAGFDTQQLQNSALNAKGN